MPVVGALNNQLRQLQVDLANLLVDNLDAHPRVIDAKRRIEEVRRQRDLEIRRLVTRGVIAEDDPDLLEAVLTHIATAVRHLR